MSGYQNFRVFVDFELDRESTSRVQNSWLDDLTKHPSITESNENYEGKTRRFLVESLSEGRLGITPHEWGIEFVFMFAVGVASGVIANVMYASLIKMLEGSDKHLRLKDSRLHVTLKATEKDVIIGVPSGKTVKLTIKQKELTVHIEVIQREEGWL